MEVPEVRCEQCSEVLKLEAHIAYEPFALITRTLNSEALSKILHRLPDRRVIFTAEKCRCPDPVGS